MRIQSYRDLVVWQRSRELVRLVYQLTETMPSRERFGLISQMRRAAISIPSNIAEGWARQYPAEFIQFLRTANGSLAELETQMILATDLNLLPSNQTEPLLAECQTLGKQILTLERRIREKQPTAQR